MVIATLLCIPAGQNFVISHFRGKPFEFLPKGEVWCWVPLEILRLVMAGNMAFLFLVFLFPPSFWWALYLWALYVGICSSSWPLYLVGELIYESMKDQIAVHGSVARKHTGIKVNTS